jgi:predicted transposase/invertase (TIGR01784 family)
MDSRKDCGKDCGRLEKLLQLLQCEGGDQAMVDSLVEQDRIFAEIDEAYRKFMADPELMYIYEGRLKARLDRNSMMGEARDDGKAEGFAEGEVIGIKKGKLETARNLKRIGVAMDTIVQATGLTREEVEGL